MKGMRVPETRAIFSIIDLAIVWMSGTQDIIDDFDSLPGTNDLDVATQESSINALLPMMLARDSGKEEVKQRD